MQFFMHRNFYAYSVCLCVAALSLSACTDNWGSRLPTYSERLEKAEQGDKEAQYFIAMDYFINKDSSQAFDQMKESADNGYAPAQEMMGKFYEDGYTVDKNPAEAAKWYEMAAKQGWRSAQEQLGLSYMNGKGVPQDYKQARYWLEKAKQAGSSDAAESLEALNKLEKK